MTRYILTTNKDYRINLNSDDETLNKFKISMIFDLLHVH
jgi:hypothetical protein